MYGDMFLPADDGTCAALLDDATTLASQHMSAWRRRCGLSVSDALANVLLDAAMRATLAGHRQCGPVFPGLSALVDALDTWDHLQLVHEGGTR